MITMCLTVLSEGSLLLGTFVVQAAITNFPPGPKYQRKHSSRMRPVIFTSLKSQ